MEVFLKYRSINLSIFSKQPLHQIYPLPPPYHICPIGQFLTEKKEYQKK